MARRSAISRYGAKAPGRLGLKHPTFAPYGGFTRADGHDIVISIQNKCEWADFCRCANNAARVENRECLATKVEAAFALHTHAEVIDRLTDAQTTYGSVNSLHDLIKHPQLRTRPMPVGRQR